MGLITSLIYEITVLFLTILIIVYLWFQNKFSYWSKKGVAGPKPIFPFGNIESVIRRKKQFFQLYIDNYFKYRHLPYVGMYSFHTPVLSINDLDVARLILIKDFDHFQSHGIFSGGVGDPLAGHLFNMHGETWKNLRKKISPSFSPGKLKNMYPLVENIANGALKYASEKDTEVINFSDFYAKYSMEIVGSVGFGVECNGFNDNDSEFFVRGSEYFVPKSLYWNFVRAVAFFVPNLFEKLKIRRISPKILDFFYNLVQETVEYRKKHYFKRNDFLQNLIELQNGQIIDETGEIKYVYGFPFSMNDVACNTMLYMFAGYETSATTGQFAAYELAANPHIQDKVRKEILTVLAKYGGKCTYEAQNEMVYLNMVLDETMRKHPPLRALFRRCTKEYKMPNTDLVIEEGTLVFVPINAIQMDPEVFPEPDKFDPDRFTPENKARLHPCAWMPFGVGPRKCLGIRQGYIQSKMALVKILQKYELLLDDRMTIPTKIKVTSLVSAAEGGIWLKLKRLHPE